MLKAIEHADCQPQFIDVESDTFCISAQDLTNKIDQVDAVIAVHMFGNMSDMQALRAITKDKPIIEDCAQALDSRIGDSIAGSFGDIAFFSFRSGKYLSAGEGGAVFSVNEEFRDSIGKSIKSLQDASKLNDIVHTFKTYIRSKLRSKPLYGLVGYQLWALYNKSINPSTNASIIINNIYKSDHAIAARRIKSIDDAITKQRDNALFYAQNLKLEQGMTCTEKPGVFYNRYIYPIIFPSQKQRDLMAKYMYIHGIGAIKPYHDIAAIATKYHGYRGDCPVSEKIAERVLAIPSHYHLREKERQYIAGCLNEGWATIRNQ